MNWPLLLIGICSVMSLLMATFHFNMTKQLDDESRLLDSCIHTDIQIPNCEMIYGSIDKPYGDKIK